MFWTTDDETKGNGELASLAENFREQAATLVDMLDISIPMVAKLKVQTKNCSNCILYVLCYIFSFTRVGYMPTAYCLPELDFVKLFHVVMVD